MGNSDDFTFEDELKLSKLSEDVIEMERYIKEFNQFLPTPVCILTPANSIVDVNDALKALSGYNETDFLGKDISFIFGGKKNAKRLIDKLNLKKDFKGLEMRLITKDRQSVVVSVSEAVRKDDQGNHIGYLMAITDINELKELQDNLEERVRTRTKKLELAQKKLISALSETRKANQATEEEQQKTSAIISNLVDPVLVADSGHYLILANDAALNILKISKNDIGKKITIDRKHPYSFNCFKKYVHAIYTLNNLKDETGDYLLVEEVIIETDSGIVPKKSPFMSNATPYSTGAIVYKVITVPVIGQNKKQFGCMKVFYNLTRERLLDQMKSEFISIAAHQLRTPLSAIKWSINSILNGDLGEVNQEQKEALTKGYLSNERIIHLVNDLLDLSRIEEGRFKYSFVKCSCDDVLPRVLEGFNDAIKDKKIKLTIKKPKKTPKFLADQEKMFIVIQNILGNAVKYTPIYGKIGLEVKIEGKYLCLSIKDNGVGIPKSDQVRIFTKFYRGENVVRTHTEGSGLGLYIAKNIIEGHNGKMEFKSEEGIGTEFIIKLPIKKK